MLILFIPFALFVLFMINTMTNTLCIQKDIPDDKQPKVFQTINILITILLTSSYVKILLA